MKLSVRIRIEKGFSENYVDAEISEELGGVTFLDRDLIYTHIEQLVTDTQTRVMAQVSNQHKIAQAAAEAKKVEEARVLMAAPTLDEVIAAVSEDDNSGFCLECGEQTWGVEPDARKYRCESCGALAVYGAEECLLMMA